MAKKTRNPGKSKNETYRKNSEVILARNKAWREKNPTYHAEYAKINAFTVRSYNAEWRAANREKVKAYNAKYYWGVVVPKRERRRAAARGQS